MIRAPLHWKEKGLVIVDSKDCLISSHYAIYTLHDLTKTIIIVFPYQKVSLSLPLCVCVCVYICIVLIFGLGVSTFSKKLAWVHDQVAFIIEKVRIIWEPLLLSYIYEKSMSVVLEAVFSRIAKDILLLDDMAAEETLQVHCTNLPPIKFAII